MQSKPSHNVLRLSRTLRFTWLGCAALVFCLHLLLDATAHAAQDGQPNLVLIFADDQGYQDIGCFGSPNIKTPNLDRMAKQGMKFTDFYVAAPICSASRAALMTGSYCQRVGITGVYFPNSKNGLNPKEITIAEILKSQGYATACIGKWHLGHHPKFLPTNHGFDSYFGIPYSNDMDGVKGKDRNLDRAWREVDHSPWNVPLMRDTRIIERPADQKTLTKRYTQEAIKFITQNKDKRFFLYLPHTMPHIPLFVSKDFYVDDPRKAYKATIEEIDWSVGQIFATLAKLKLDDNTLVVYTSDNGPWLSKKHHGGSAKPLRDGKFSTYEGGMRVPCIMRWPGKIPAGTVCSELAATIDILPTFAKLAGGKAPTDRVIDGKDISQLMFKPGSKTPHEAYYFYRGNNLQAVRSGKWKLNLPRGRRKGKKNQAQQKPAGQLHDLSTDIGEKKDVAKEHADIVEKLTAKAKQFDAALKQNKRPAGSLN